MGCTTSLPLYTNDEPQQPLQEKGSPISDYLSSAFSSCEMAWDNTDEIELTDYCSDDSENIIERYEQWMFTSHHTKPSPLTSITEVTDVNDEPSELFECDSGANNSDSTQSTDNQAPGEDGSP
ncbi:hypothetical protein P9112_013515 [Eukaryota sp. TZLM1-RC]